LDAKPDFKPGEVLGVKDLERIRPFVPPGYLEQLTFPNLKLRTIARRDHTPRRDFMECTEKYQAQVRLDPDGALANYVCGQPFADATLNPTGSPFGNEGRLEFLHDRDAIFSTGLGASVTGLGLEVIKTPVRSPKANSPCERLIGTLRRECLDWIIPVTEKHLRKTLLSWSPHYNRGRTHSSLGPGIPDPPPALPVHLQRHRHRFDQSTQIVAHSVLNGLHHEYSFMARAA
jgi:hypothetical protein